MLVRSRGQAVIVVADDLLRRSAIGNRQRCHVGGQAGQPRSHAGRVLGVLAVEPLPERDHDGLGQRLARLGRQLPGELVRLVALDAQRDERSIDAIADFYRTVSDTPQPGPSNPASGLLFRVATELAAHRREHLFGELAEPA